MLDHRYGLTQPNSVNTQLIFIHRQMLLGEGSMNLEIFTSTMESRKETHKYAFELVKASRTMPVDRAEKQPHIQEIRTNYLQQALKLRANKKFS